MTILYALDSVTLSLSDTGKLLNCRPTNFIFLMYYPVVTRASLFM